ncbi:MAG: hypothetical protein GVY19_09590 [Bacteroidetes bacterium]|nr:hypothetical protein [Bacteroidota bacterium]
MNNFIKKLVSYILIVLVLLFTVIGLLGVWEIINLHNIVPKIIGSLLIIFAAAAVVLFIFSVLIKENE